MTTTTPDPTRTDPPALPALEPVVGLLREIGDLKRLRDAGGTGSLADRAFLRSWRRLVAGQDVEQVAVSETARALAAARLGGIDAAVLRLAGLSPEDVRVVLRRSVDAALATTGETLGELSDVLAAVGADASPGAGLPTPPPFAVALVHQPRAGATHPTRPRVLVEPPESHGDHCFVTAIYSALLAPSQGVSRGDAFLVALAHHLPNADLPDAGFGGELLLGEHLPAVFATLTERSLAQLPNALSARLRELLPTRETTATPLGRVFNAADVLDRVLQVHHHARAAAFTAEQALDDLDLVHPGPVQGFQLQVLSDAGLPVR
ncbi:HD domain-containing protein [Kineococcus rubinsiae]|uniref:HD domain-containing protein n=1 Tax=Kineococcus rubinsiae TaxID=2609562 RepID=UPI00142FB816|nr:HD domain-containing protein [Kineococcus rubinsiae]NIZ91455.1 HD domain-containing protein [Kineococcus rubinsiae]